MHARSGSSRTRKRLCRDRQPRIVEAVRSRGGNAILSDRPADCGTTRCAHALERIATDAEIILNLQADEPFIATDDIRNLADSLSDPAFRIATLARKFDPADGFETLFSPDNTKVVFDNSMGALYFSRSIIPYVRGVEWKQWLETATFHIHAGTYAFRRQTLLSLPSLPPRPQKRPKGSNNSDGLPQDCGSKSS